MGIFKRLLSSLFVDKYNCISCDDELEHPNRYGLCDTCMSEMERSEGNICEKCGKHMLDEAKYCNTCQNHHFFFDINRSRYIYRGKARDVIRHLKFGGGKYLVKYIAEHYIDMYREFGYNADVVVSVPISPRRLRERGYNQSAEIAKIVADRLGLPYIEDAVVKIKELRPQEELGGKERIESVIGAYALNNKDAVKGKNILLIDDILTTGATMSAVSVELKRVALRVECLVFASPEVKYKEEHGSLIDDYIDRLEQD